MKIYIKPLTVYDFPDKKWDQDGYDMKEVPDTTTNNFVVLLDKINELIAEHNEQHLGE